MNKHAVTVDGKTYKRSSLNRTYTHLVTGDDNPTPPSFYSAESKALYEPRKGLDLGWSSRLDLAEKNAAAHRARGYVNVRVVPVTMTQSKPSSKPARSQQEREAANEGARAFVALRDAAREAGPAEARYLMLNAAEFIATVKLMEAKGYYLVTIGRPFDAIAEVRVDDQDADNSRVLWDRGLKCGSFKARQWTTFVEFISSAELERRQAAHVATQKEGK